MTGALEIIWGCGFTIVDNVGRARPRQVELNVQGRRSLFACHVGETDVLDSQIDKAVSRV